MPAGSRYTIDPPGAPGLVRRGAPIGLVLLVAGLLIAGRELRLGFLAVPGIDLVYCGAALLALTALALWFGTRGQTRAARRLIATSGGQTGDRVLIIGQPSTRLLGEFVTLLSPDKPVEWRPTVAPSTLQQRGEPFDLAIYQSAVNGRPGPRDQDLTELARVLVPGGRLLVLEVLNAARHAAAMTSAGLQPARPPTISWRTRVVVALALELDVLRADKPEPAAGPPAAT